MRPVPIADHNLALPEQTFSSHILEDFVLRARLDELETYAELGLVGKFKRKERLIKRIRENEMRGEL